MFKYTKWKDHAQSGMVFFIEFSQYFKSFTVYDGIRKGSETVSMSKGGKKQCQLTAKHGNRM